MTKNIGLWIDHKKATIVIQNGKGEELQKIESGLGRHVKYRGASHSKSPYSAQYQQGDDQLDNKFKVHLNKFYDQLIALIRGSESVLIIGPGEAKSELRNRLEHEKVRSQVVELETADKMTDRQFAAKVRRHFRESGAGKNILSR
ncbi:MAG: hypothetical protein HZB50_19210 [Chloroflexi bacterium]|nr:hypothetical protein [Chloroflexota bacterium]